MIYFNIESLPIELIFYITNYCDLQSVICLYSLNSEWKNLLEEILIQGRLNRAREVIVGEISKIKYEIQHDASHVHSFRTTVGKTVSYMYESNAPRFVLNARENSNGKLVAKTHLSEINTHSTLLSSYTSNFLHCTNVTGANIKTLNIDEIYYKNNHNIIITDNLIPTLFIDE